MPRGEEGAEPFAAAVAAELRGIGLGEGEFQVVLSERDPGATGGDDVAFLIRPNPGLPFGPVAETASGGELSRIALAIAAVAGGETMVFDEIDAGIGGQTAHAVAETLRRLAGRAQVVTITHLPQIASVADVTSGSKRCRATRRTRGSSSSRARAPCRAQADAWRRRVPRLARTMSGARPGLADPVRSMASVRGQDALLRSKPVSFGAGKSGAR